MNVKLFVEGGGDSKELHARCREAFRKLLEKAGFLGRMPRIVACGGRNAAHGDFCTAFAMASTSESPMLLVDSESPVHGATWPHLGRNGLQRPKGASDDQAQLMVVCMETWVLADHAALKGVFGQGLRTNALLPRDDLESRTKDDVQQSLAQATRDCGREGRYQKGRRSFQVLAELDPDVLKTHLPHFQRLVASLDRRLGLLRS